MRLCAASMSREKPHSGSRFSCRGMVCKTSLDVGTETFELVLHTLQSRINRAFRRAVTSDCKICKFPVRICNCAWISQDPSCIDLALDQLSRHWLLRRTSLRNARQGRHRPLLLCHCSAQTHCLAEYRSENQRGPDQGRQSNRCPHAITTTPA